MRVLYNTQDLHSTTTIIVATMATMHDRLTWINPISTATTTVTNNHDHDQLTTTVHDDDHDHNYTYYRHAWPLCVTTMYVMSPPPP